MYVRNRLIGNMIHGSTEIAISVVRDRPLVFDYLVASRFNSPQQIEAVFRLLLSCGISIGQNWMKIRIVMLPQ